MQEGPELLDLLGPLLPRLEALGMFDVAQRLIALTEPSDLLSLTDAAYLLGLRSRSTVRSLAEQGHLEAFWEDGEEMLIGRRSAEAFVDSPYLVGQRHLEAQLWSALADF